MLPVPITAVPQVHVGQTVDVNVLTLDSTFPGKVTRFANDIQTSTRTMNTEVDVPNPKLTIVPGMYAEVRLHLKVIERCSEFTARCCRRSWDRGAACLRTRPARNRPHHHCEGRR